MGTINLGISDIMGQMGRMAGMSGITASDVMGSAKPVPEFPPRAEVELFPTRYLAAGGNHSVGVLVFGLDSYPRVAQRFGSDLADKIALKFGRLLEQDSNRRPHRCLLPGRVAIVAPAPIAPSVRVSPSACAGAGCSADFHSRRAGGYDRKRRRRRRAWRMASRSADDFRCFANGRMDAALKAGGNRVESGQSRTSEDFRKDEFVLRLKEIMTSVSPEALQPCLGERRPPDRSRTQADRSGIQPGIAPGRHRAKAFGREPDPRMMG